MAGTALFGRPVMWRVATVVALRDETPTARTLTLDVPDWPGHFAGQHVDVRVTAPDGYSAVRSYSIASAPDSQAQIELTIEQLPNGEVSPYLTQVVAPGASSRTRRPSGGARSDRRLVRVAHGANRTRSANRRWLRNRSAHGHDSLARFRRKQVAISIVVFRARTGSNFLPRRIADAIP